MDKVTGPSSTLQVTACHIEKITILEQVKKKDTQTKILYMKIQYSKRWTQQINLEGGGFIFIYFFFNQNNIVITYLNT